MNTKQFLIIASIIVVSAGVARADEINGSPTGLPSPAQTITFDEIPLTPNSPLTNQYASLGVTFSPNVYYFPQTGSFPNIDGKNIGNFILSMGPAVNPLTMTFSTPMSGVAFAMTADDAPYLFQALSGGIPVDSFTSTVLDFNGNNFYGFSSESFNQITITQEGSGLGPYWLIDNIQSDPSVTPTSTPEPASLTLLGSGLLALGLVRRRI